MVLMWLAIYGLVLAGMVLVPRLSPEGLAKDDLHQLVATLAVWISSAVLMEYWPLHQPPNPPAETPGKEMPQA
jgi:hypothetical protein